MNKTTPNTINPAIAVQDKWFEELKGQVSHQLNCDNMQLKTKTASAETERFYAGLMSNDIFKTVEVLQEQINVTIIVNMLQNFLMQLNTNIGSKKLKALAFHIKMHTIRLWIELENDEDESLEDALILAEAHTNGTFKAHGIQMSTMIFDALDKIERPPQFVDLLPNLRPIKPITKWPHSKSTSHS